MEYRKTKALDAALYGLVEFKHEFGADLSPACLGELYAASALSLNLVAKKSNPGFDLIGDDGQRYQVKERAASTLNVDVNKFRFRLAYLDQSCCRLYSRRPLETRR